MVTQKKKRTPKKKKSKSKEHEKSVLEEKLTRRDFIKKGIITAVGLGIGAYSLNKLTNIDNNILKKSLITDKITGIAGASSELTKFTIEAKYYVSLGNNVQCLNCPHQCTLGIGERGICRVRENINGKLYAFAFGNPAAIHNDPIEKKPLFHFLPSTYAFSIATGGCNFRCLNCQNWELSQFKPDELSTYELFPVEVVTRAKDYGSKSIAYTYSEPCAWFEYMFETSKLAKQAGLRNVWITNGYLNPNPLKELITVMDAANIDLKGFTEEFYNKVCSGRLQPVLDTLKTAHEKKMWFEITNLIIPTLNDNYSLIREMCEWILNNLGPGYPLHFSRFHPDHKLLHLPSTPVKTLEKAREIALGVGLHFVYIGNVPSHPAENTYCPNCNEIIIQRRGFNVIKNSLINSKCPSCSTVIPGVWK